MHSYKLFVMLVLGLMVGCTSQSVKEESAAAANSAQLANAEAAKKAAEKEKAKARQNAKTAIDPKVMYLLLAAELAGQRNQYDVALEGYMQAASQVSDARIAERAAKIALFLQENKKADEAVGRWLQQDANNLDAQAVAALTALRAGRKSDAIKHLQALLKNDPAGFEGMLQELLKSLGSSGNNVLVMQVLDELALKNPEQAVISFMQALLAMQNKDNALAEDKLQKTLALQPSWDKALVAQAQLAVLNEDLDKAETLLRSNMEKFPDDLRFKRMLAQVLIKEAKFDDAIVVYRDLLAGHPDDGDSIFSLALLHLELQQDDEARKYLQQLINKPEWSGQAALYLGKLAAKDGQFAKALNWFDSVTQGPSEFEAAMSAASLLTEQRRFGEALQRVERLQTRFPIQKVRILAMQAEIYNHQKQYQKAYNVLTDALKEIPGQKELLYTRSLVSEKMGDLVSMEKDLHQILKKHPEDVAALNALGYSLANKTQRYREAEVYLKKALKLQPQMAVVMDSYGWLLFKQGKLDAAYDYLQQAYEKQAEPEIAGHLVEVLSRLGRIQEAKALLQKVLAVQPDDEYLLELKKKLFN